MPNNQPPPPPSQATPSASTTPPRRAAGSAQPTLGELIARISENISALVRGEIDLAKAKGQRMAKEMGLGAGLLAAAGVLALFIFGLLLGALTTGLSHVMPLWAASMTVRPASAVDRVRSRVRAARGSSSEVASSRMSVCGSSSTSRASATSWAWAGLSSR